MMKMGRQDDGDADWRAATTTSRKQTKTTEQKQIRYCWRRRVEGFVTSAFWPRINKAISALSQYYLARALR